MQKIPNSLWLLKKITLSHYPQSGLTYICDKVLTHDFFFSILYKQMFHVICF